jgi:hypothetical protein
MWRPSMDLREERENKRKEKKNVDDTMKVQQLHVLHKKKEEAKTNRKAR